MDHPASRAMSAASAAYGLFASLKPRHLADNMQARGRDVAKYDKLARAYGARDLSISAVGLLAPGRAVPVAMGLRIASDLTDALVLGTAAPNGKVRRKILGVTLGWAALNAAALVVDRRR